MYRSHVIKSQETRKSTTPYPRLAFFYFIYYLHSAYHNSKLYYFFSLHTPAWHTHKLPQAHTCTRAHTVHMEGQPLGQQMRALRDGEDRTQEVRFKRPDKIVSVVSLRM